MNLKGLSLIALTTCLLFAPTLQAADVEGLWLLDGPGTESELLLTGEGRRIQGQYDLLVDDPSLDCVPASTSRVWANPNSRIKIEQDDERILISYELFDLRREIPIGDESVLSDLPSTKNINGRYFTEMGSSFAHFDGERLIIESRNHSPGYIRTSRGIPQGPGTTTTEELRVENDRLYIRHTYRDEILFEQPLVLEYFFKRVAAADVELYNCTDADYDWFLELNSDRGESDQ